MKGEVQTGNQQDPENSKLLSYILLNTVPFTLKSPVVITDATTKIQNQLPADYTRQKCQGQQNFPFQDYVGVHFLFSSRYKTTRKP